MREAHMIYYDRSASNDLRLVEWYGQLMQSGDMHKIFMPSIDTLCKFLGTFQPPTELVLDLDPTDDQPQMAAWLTPVVPGVASFGAWIREDKRHSPTVVGNLMSIYDLIFQKTELIFGFTKQSCLDGVHTKLGYEMVAEVPGMWGTESGWIYKLSKENFHGQRYRRSLKDAGVDREGEQRSLQAGS